MNIPWMVSDDDLSDLEPDDTLDPRYASFQPRFDYCKRTLIKLHADMDRIRRQRALQRAAAPVLEDSDKEKPENGKTFLIVNSDSTTLGKEPANQLPDMPCSSNSTSLTQAEEAVQNTGVPDDHEPPEDNVQADNPRPRQRGGRRPCRAKGRRVSFSAQKPEDSDNIQSPNAPDSASKSYRGKTRDGHSGRFTRRSVAQPATTTPVSARSTRGGRTSSGIGRSATTSRAAPAQDFRDPVDEQCIDLPVPPAQRHQKHQASEQGSSSRSISDAVPSQHEGVVMNAKSVHWVDEVNNKDSPPMAKKLRSDKIPGRSATTSRAAPAQDFRDPVDEQCIDSSAPPAQHSQKHKASEQSSSSGSISDAVPSRHEGVVMNAKSANSVDEVNNKDSPPMAKKLRSDKIPGRSATTSRAAPAQDFRDPVNEQCIDSPAPPAQRHQKHQASEQSSSGRSISEAVLSEGVVMKAKLVHSVSEVNNKDSPPMAKKLRSDKIPPAVGILNELQNEQDARIQRQNFRKTRARAEDPAAKKNTGPVCVAQPPAQQKLDEKKAQSNQKTPSRHRDPCFLVEIDHSNTDFLRQVQETAAAKKQMIHNLYAPSRALPCPEDIWAEADAQITQIAALQAKQTQQPIEEDSQDEQDPVDQAPVGEVPSNQVLADEAPMDQASMDEAPLAEALMEEAPVDQASMDETLVNQVPMDETLVNQVPMDEAPVDQASMDEAPVDQAPMEEAPVEQASMDEAPMNLAPMNDTLMDEALSDQALMNEVPVDQVPMKEVPLDQALMDEAPVAETLSDQNPADDALETPKKQDTQRRRSSKRNRRKTMSAKKKKTAPAAPYAVPNSGEKRKRGRPRKSVPAPTRGEQGAPAEPEELPVEDQPVEHEQARVRDDSIEFVDMGCEAVSEDVHIVNEIRDEQIEPEPEKDTPRPSRNLRARKCQSYATVSRTKKKCPPSLIKFVGDPNREVTSEVIDGNKYFTNLAGEVRIDDSDIMDPDCAFEDVEKNYKSKKYVDQTPDDIIPEGRFETRFTDILTITRRAHDLSDAHASLHPEDPATSFVESMEKEEAKLHLLSKQISKIRDFPFSDDDLNHVWDTTPMSMSERNEWPTNYLHVHVYIAEQMIRQHREDFIAGQFTAKWDHPMQFVKEVARQCEIFSSTDITVEQFSDPDLVSLIDIIERNENTEHLYVEIIETFPKTLAELEDLVRRCEMLRRLQSFLQKHRFIFNCTLKHIVQMVHSKYMPRGGMYLKFLLNIAYHFQFRKSQNRWEMVAECEDHTVFKGIEFNQYGEPIVLKKLPNIHDKLEADKKKKEQQKLKKNKK